MFDKLISTVTGFLPNLLWLVLAVLVGVTIDGLFRHGGLSVDEYVQGVVMVIAAGVTTALWLGAIHNAD